LIDTFVKSGAGGVNYIGSMTFGPDSSLYLTSCINNSVLRYDGTTGEFKDAFVKSGSGGLNGTTFLRFVTR
jgi:hypothetical protein